MATNLNIDDELMAKALKIGGFKTKKETVNVALQEFVQRRAAEDIIALFGTVDFDESYDYKAERRRDGKSCD